eukprot:Plantae.Rhodophyta-Purpureofilum_apyrenoidigerum.ctg4855.p1 GENE.Plantae.Rhodophyta-Purpureofilum_apyrenoidigerum.ctg4855~~Plantae.Rhodophyta-Purpureofilum_apyrenoidigerum.ctg4855.p1  ORF type:complete len:140 (-),score=7.39 Plantae.Rhodophyta-Purpureofilum_apyrenoidigerum.ctg4855:175-594(-)
MNYLLEKTFSFEAMHVLVGHDGKCARPHGHSYSLTVGAAFDRLHQEGPKRNMAMDFGDISSIVRPMIEKYLDHQNLNETLATSSPTAEFIAIWIFSHLSKQLPQLETVTVRETATSSVTISNNRRCDSCKALSNNIERA